MTQSSASLEPPRQRPSGVLTPALVGTGVLVVLLVAGLAWAKWLPYAGKVLDLGGTHRWDGSSLLRSSGPAGATPTWSGTWDFTLTYGLSIWKALVVGLVVAAAVDALLPRRWLHRLLQRRGHLAQSLSGGLLAVPCMMCTCCGAPVAVSLRRNGVPTSSALGYWLGNPVLNPAVLVFLFLAAPWQWGVVRLVVGVAVVFGATAAVGRFADRRAPSAIEDGTAVVDERAKPLPAVEERAKRVSRDHPDPPLAELPGRFLRSLLRFTLVLVPEYFVVVLLLGALSGWVSSFGTLQSHLGLLAVLVAAVIGTMLVIPTAGEIPILLGLSALGLSAGVIGALLITLPAVSLPSMVMVSRSMSVRITAATAAAVAVAGIAGGALLWALPH